MLRGVALLAFLPVFLIDHHGWASTDAAFLLAGVFGTAGIARVALGWRADRTGRRARPALALAVATVILTVGLALSADAPEPVVVALLAAAIVVATANVGLTATMLAGTVDLRARGRALALRQTVVSLGVSLAAPADGVAGGRARLACRVRRRRRRATGLVDSARAVRQDGAPDAHRAPRARVSAGRRHHLTGGCGRHTW